MVVRYRAFLVVTSCSGDRFVLSVDIGLIASSHVNDAGLSTAATDASQRQWSVAAVGNPFSAHGLWTLPDDQITALLQSRQQSIKLTVSDAPAMSSEVA